MHDNNNELQVVQALTVSNPQNMLSIWIAILKSKHCVACGAQTLLAQTLEALRIASQQQRASYWVHLLTKAPQPASAALLRMTSLIESLTCQMPARPAVCLTAHMSNACTSAVCLTVYQAKTARQGGALMGPSPLEHLSHIGQQQPSAVLPALLPPLPLPQLLLLPLPPALLSAHGDPKRLWVCWHNLFTSCLVHARPLGAKDGPLIQSSQARHGDRLMQRQSFNHKLWQYRQTTCLCVLNLKFEFASLCQGFTLTCQPTEELGQGTMCGRHTRSLRWRGRLCQPWIASCDIWQTTPPRRYNFRGAMHWVQAPCLHHML